MIQFCIFEFSEYLDVLRNAPEVSPRPRELNFRDIGMSWPQFAQIVAEADATDAALRLIDVEADREKKLDEKQHDHNQGFHFSLEDNTSTRPTPNSPIARREDPSSFKKRRS
jgi:hypothetical protein